MKQAFIDAKRAEVEQIEALARQTLDAHPFDESNSETVEAEWRELAHAMRQIGPLFEAWEKAELGHPGFVEHRGGFNRRLDEAITTVGQMCAYGRIDRLHHQKIGKKDRPNAKSVFLAFIEKFLRENPSAATKDVKDAFLRDAEDDLDGTFDKHDDLLVTRKLRELPDQEMQISSISAADSKVRKKNLDG